MNQAGNQSALFDYYGKPSFSQAFPLAMQHVVAAIVGCVTPAIIVSGAAGLNPTDKVFFNPGSPSRGRFSHTFTVISHWQ